MEGSGVSKLPRVAAFNYKRTESTRSARHGSKDAEDTATCGTSNQACWEARNERNAKNAKNGDTELPMHAATGVRGQRKRRGRSRRWAVGHRSDNVRALSSLGG